VDGFELQSGRKHDSRRTRANILAAASRLFAEKGYSAANISDIADLAQTTKPMIYYHFGNKEALFAAVLEDVYAQMREIERAVPMADVPARAAMRTLVEATFDYHAAHPDWVRLIAVANIHDAQHIQQLPTIAAQNAAVLAILDGLLQRGVAEGVFRSGIDPLHVHLLISAFCFHRVSNRHSWRLVFQRDLVEAEEAARQREVVVEAVLRYLS